MNFRSRFFIIPSNRIIKHENINKMILNKDFRNLNFPNGNKNETTSQSHSNILKPIKIL